MPYDIRAWRGIQLAIPADDWMYAGDIIDTYEAYVFEPFLKAVRGRETVLDVGANIGMYSMLAAPHVQNVVALDASPDNAKLILANARLNGLTNISVYPVAVSNQTGMATFTREASTNKVMAPHHIDTLSIDSIDVALALPIDTLLPHIRVDVMKIDVEGREYAAMLGAQKILAQKPIVFSEYSHNFIKGGCGVEGVDYLDLYFSRGYTATILYRDMTQEHAATAAAVQERWQRYMDAGITHIDLMFNPPAALE